ncbi:hypothetical protein QBC34DRAFT_129615 [Podospora aff. communis PSN243]|uniref:Uncharacterized protein n=1 Tax=Podospora aff. communis PSN243 TaxID=3040156 RepID=A0AAV9GJG0_9PEZI|nr:hypothetical protein QBC34DRAFT_129615 [Podospora aff. communis PSN243]
MASHDPVDEAGGGTEDCVGGDEISTSTDDLADCSVPAPRAMRCGTASHYCDVDCHGRHTCTRGCATLTQGWQHRIMYVPAGTSWAWKEAYLGQSRLNRRGRFTGNSWCCVSTQPVRQDSGVINISYGTVAASTLPLEPHGTRLETLGRLPSFPLSSLARLAMADVIYSSRETTAGIGVIRCVTAGISVSQRTVEARVTVPKTTRSALRCARQSGASDPAWQISFPSRPQPP